MRASRPRQPCLDEHGIRQILQLLPIFHSEKHNRRGKKMINDAVTGNIYKKKIFCMCKCIIHSLPHAGTALPRWEECQSASFVPKAKCAACVLKCTHVCAKEKIRRSSRSQGGYHYVVKAILKGYSSATDILKKRTGKKIANNTKNIHN